MSYNFRISPNVVLHVGETEELQALAKLPIYYTIYKQPSFFFGGEGQFANYAVNLCFTSITEHGFIVKRTIEVGTCSRHDKDKIKALFAEADQLRQKLIPDAKLGIYQIEASTI